MIKALNIKLLKSYLNEQNPITSKEKIQKTLIELKLHMGVLAPRHKN
jgi:hypothetical protein